MASPEDEDGLSEVQKLFLKMARRGFPVDLRDPPPEEPPPDQASQQPAKAKKDETS